MLDNLSEYHVRWHIFTWWRDVKMSMMWMSNQMLGNQGVDGVTIIRSLAKGDLESLAFRTHIRGIWTILNKNWIKRRNGSQQTWKGCRMMYHPAIKNARGYPIKMRVTTQNNDQKYETAADILMVDESTGKSLVRSRISVDYFRNIFEIVNCS